MSNTAAKTAGAHHIGLTVPDLKSAVSFFTEALGHDVVGEVPDYPAAFVSDGTVMITLWQAKTDKPVPFDRATNLGLHHLAFRVPGQDALLELHNTLSARDDASIEFSPEALGSTDIKHMMVRIPGNIRVEFIAA